MLRRDGPAGEIFRPLENQISLAFANAVTSDNYNLEKFLFLCVIWSVLVV